MADIGDLEQNYQATLVRVWDALSDAIEGGRLTRADAPDDYDAFVHLMIEAERARDEYETACGDDCSIYATSPYLNREPRTLAQAEQDTGRKV